MSVRGTDDMLAPTQILVATDFCEASDAAFAYGREFASRFGATLHLLHVVEPLSLKTFGVEPSGALAPLVQADLEDAARKQLDEMLMDSDGSGPPTRRELVTAVSPAAAILEYAREEGIDLIVIGTHGRGALAHLLMGSVAERVVRLAPCPVLTVRHPEREFVLPDTLMTVARA